MLQDLLHDVEELHLHHARDVHDEGAVALADERGRGQPTAPEALEDHAALELRGEQSDRAAGSSGSASGAASGAPRLIPAGAAELAGVQGWRKPMFILTPS